MPALKMIIFIAFQTIIFVKRSIKLYGFEYNDAILVTTG